MAEEKTAAGIAKIILWFDAFLDMEWDMVMDGNGPGEAWVVESGSVETAMQQLSADEAHVARKAQERYEAER